MGARKGDAPAVTGAPGTSTTGTADRITIRARCCPVDPSHVAAYDTETELVECEQCQCLMLDRRAARILLDLRAERDVLAEVVAARDGRLERSRARNERIAELYIAGLAEVAA